MSIPENVGQQFQNLLTEILSGRLVLVACERLDGGDPGYVLGGGDPSTGGFFPLGQLLTLEEVQDTFAPPVAGTTMLRMDVSTPEPEPDPLEPMPELKKFFLTDGHKKGGQ